VSVVGSVEWTVVGILNFDFGGGSSGDLWLPVRGEEEAVVACLCVWISIMPVVVVCAWSASVLCVKFSIS